MYRCAPTRQSHKRDAFPLSRNLPDSTCFAAGLQRQPQDKGPAPLLWSKSAFVCGGCRYAEFISPPKVRNYNKMGKFMMVQ